MVFGKGNAHRLEIKLGDEAIVEVNSAKQLGTLLVAKGSDDTEFYEGRVTKARQCIFAFISMGSKYNPVCPLSASKVYKSVSLSRMIYGTEVGEISQKSLRTIENTHWSMCRTIQGLSRTSPNPTVLPSMGWMSISSTIDKMRLDFLWRILSLDPANIYKKIAIIRISQFLLQQTSNLQGPVSRALEVASRYGVLHCFSDSIHKGQFMSMSQWKRMTEKVVGSSERNQWMMTCTLYGNMQLYRAILDKQKVWVWWKVTRLVPSSVKAGVMMLRLLAGDRVHPSDDCRERCLLCNETVTEKITHILFMCDSNKAKRDLEWINVRNVMPQAMQQEIDVMSACDKSTFILSGLNSEGSMVLEWLDLYVKILTYVKIIYIDLVNRIEHMQD